MAENEANKSDLSNLGNVVGSFVHDIDALAQILTSTMFLVLAGEETQDKKFKEFARKYGDSSEREDGTIDYRFPGDYAAQAVRLMRRLRRAQRGFVLLPRSFVVSLVSSFDAHVGRLLSSVYRARPELLDVTERSLSLAEIKNLGSIDAAIEFMLAKEIESLLRQSHGEQFASMEKRFKLKLREGLTSWPEFIELTQRRNCFRALQRFRLEAGCRSSSRPTSL